MTVCKNPARPPLLHVIPTFLKNVRVISIKGIIPLPFTHAEMRDSRVNQSVRIKQQEVAMSELEFKTNTRDQGGK